MCVIFLNLSDTCLVEVCELTRYSASFTIVQKTQVWVYNQNKTKEIENG